MCYSIGVNLLYPAIGLGAALLLLTRKGGAVSTKPTIPPTDRARARPQRPSRKASFVPDNSVPGLPDQEEYVEAARDGRLTIRWIDLRSAPGWQVTTDAVQLDGVRFPVTARTAQRIADIVGASLTTPLLEDLIETDATVRIVSPTWDYRSMYTPEAVNGFNDQVNKQLAAKEAARNELVSAVGKSWVLVKGLEKKKADGAQAACNYGMFRPDGPYRSISGKYQLWQQPGYRHNIDHWDYSQVLRLCRPKTPGLPIPSHDGVELERQPGVKKETVSV